MDKKERNWKHFTDQHLRDWQGIWTRYSPQGEVKESFQSLRSFHSNHQKTKIAQTNRYLYADGKIVEESWQYNQISNSLADGLFHPSRQSMRGFFFASGYAAWITPKLETNLRFAVELFFKYNELRHSVGIIYDDRGNLFHTANIREDAAGFPSQYWSTELNQLPERNFNDNWQGTAMTITPDLNISVPVPTELNWPIEGNNIYFLPDGVSISCPSKISVGIPFKIVANWIVTTDEMQQLSVEYNEEGAFVSLTVEQFQIQSEEKVWME